MTRIMMLRNLCGVQVLRSFSSSGGNKRILVHKKNLDFRFDRSRGPGGQNVNKVNTKATAKLLVDEAVWLPEDVRNRLKKLQANRMNKDGYLLVSSDVHRTQSNNVDECISRFQEFVDDASVEEKTREQYEGISDKAKKKNIEDKRRRSDKKKSRQKYRYDD